MTIKIQGCPSVYESPGDLPKRSLFPDAGSFGERANIWVPTGLPNTNVAKMVDVDDIPLNMPR
eukprot:4031701-Amphidinium_carterae.1